MKSDSIHIWVADPSAIVRNGVAAIINQLPDIEVQMVEITSVDGLQTCLQGTLPELIVVNPLFGGWFNVHSVRQQNNEVKLVAVVHDNIDPALLRDYDEAIYLYDTTNVVLEKVMGTLNLLREEDASPESLSQREREIIVGVVKGMMNKEIADMLNISIHTVTTHRKNIARKLQIHSASGLTIYALTNKLVEIDEVKL